MKSLELYAAVAVPATAQTQNSTPVDMTEQVVPFLSDYSAVLVLGLRAAANATIKVQGSNTADSTTDWVDLVSYAVTTAETRQKLVNIGIRQRLRLQIVTTGATGAGSVDVALLGN